MAAEGFCFCRFCLVTGVKMETVNAEEIECFNDLTDSEFPLLACYECKGMLKKVNVFLTKLVTSLNIQRHILESESEISEEDIKQIDRESFNLISSLKCCEEPLVISCDTNPESTFDLDTKVPRKYTNNKRKGKVEEEIIIFNENEEPLVTSCDTNPESTFDLDTKVPRKYTNNKRKGKVEEEIIIFNENEEPLVTSCDMNPESSIDLDTKVPRTYTNNKRKGKVEEENILFNEDEEYMVSSENDEILDDDTVSLKGVLDNLINCLDQKDKVTGEKKQPKKRPTKQKVSNEKQGDKKRKPFGRPDGKKTLLEEFFDVKHLTLSEQIEEFLKRKESPNYVNNPYKCELCYRGFQYVKTYQNHVNLMHNPELGLWQCQVCRKYRNSRTSLDMHRKCHSHLYTCKICDHGPMPRTAAEKHAMWHKGATYECRICSQVFEHNESRLGHERIKHPSASSCDICGLPFVSAMGVVNHKRMAHFGYQMPDGPPDPKLYCEACKIQFVSLEAWNKHLETSAKHKPLSEVFECRHCGEACADAAELSAHQKERHMSARDANPPLRVGRGRPRPLPLPPPVPGETPEQRAAVIALARAANRATSHRLTTVDQYPQQCAHCDEVFQNRLTHWRHHMTNHFGKPYKEAKFMCELCGKRFLYDAHLRVHVKLKHSSQVGTFECKLCKAKMNNKTTLYRHMQRHLKPSHPCSVCGKALASPGSLRAHLRNQHGGPRPFECPYCHKSYIRGSILKTHVQDVHLRMARRRSKDKTKRRINIGSMPIQNPNYLY